MDKEETREVLRLICIAYPKYFRDMGKEDRNDMLDLWAIMFKDCNTTIVHKAVENIIRSSTFAPSISEVLNEYERIVKAVVGEPTDLDLFTQFRESIKRIYFYDDAVKEFNNLHPAIRKYVGSPGALLEYGRRETEEIVSYVRNDFLKTVPNIRKNAELEYALPQSIVVALKKGVKQLEASDNNQGREELPS